ncbi:alpha/beta fold hydrolase [Maritimibacter sp. HL-12]|uniref:alpha/beta fold hydrolase n=1 Tax=Maritimibacter sp. HL-12 TaxID=1162418 RepID=UPI000A0F3FB1|nr:alpha/beta hydrolase [Maritimibacter sp. HL-12]SMH36184.1 Pimeloyl-ACP methyl ester carboxylesterase [Maritimibacter sp. HL-12]
MSTAITREVCGFPTHVVHVGCGVRRALFIHCTLGHTGTWTRVQAALLEKLAMTAFDRPGHGKSAGWSGEGGALGLHDLTTRIAAALIDKRADVIGHSYGATVALRLAMERPGMVRSVTLIEPPLFALAAGTAAHEAHMSAMAGFGAALAAGDREAAARVFQTAMNPDAPWSSLSDRARTRLADQIERIAEERGVTMDDAPGLTMPDRIEALSLPVLLIEGSASPPIVHAVHEALAARLPQARRVMVAGAGHMSPLTHPEGVAGEIAAFLKV